MFWIRLFASISYVQAEETVCPDEAGHGFIENGEGDGREARAGEIDQQEKDVVHGGSLQNRYTLTRL